MTIDASTPTKLAEAVMDVRTILDELHLIAIHQTLRSTEKAVVAAIEQLSTARLWAQEAVRIYLEDGD